MVLKFLVSIALLSTAGVLAWVYLRGPTHVHPDAYPLRGHRPWRKMGAALCLLIAVMFVLGIYVVDIPDRPVPYAMYWIIMLGLVVWLFVLAVHDIMHTRKLVRQWRLRNEASRRP